MEILGDHYGDQGLVFTTERGTPISPSNLRQRSLAPLVKKAELPNIRLHDIRHTCATLLLTNKMHPKFVQVLLDGTKIWNSNGRSSKNDSSETNSRTGTVVGVRLPTSENSLHAKFGEFLFWDVGE
jgi:hypothetical protein